MNESELLVLLHNNPTKTTFTGWVTPSGNIVATENFGHLEGLPEDDRLDPLQQARYRAEGLEEQHARVFREAYDGENHTPWHCYDSSEYEYAKDDLRQLIIAYAYALGYARFYFVRWFADRRGTEIPSLNIEATKATIVRIANQMNRFLKLQGGERVTYEEYTPEQLAMVADPVEWDKCSWPDDSELDVRSEVEIALDTIRKTVQILS